MHGNNSSPTMGGDTLYSGHKGSSAESGAMLTGAAVGAGAAAAGVRGTSNVPGDRTSGVVLPRVRDENQGGERWIETGAEVTVLWPYVGTKSIIVGEEVLTPRLVGTKRVCLMNWTYRPE